MEGGYDLTLAMTGEHCPGFLRDLYGCLLLNEYYNETSESFVGYPENVSERIVDK